LGKRGRNVSGRGGVRLGLSLKTLGENERRKRTMGRVRERKLRKTLKINNRERGTPGEPRFRDDEEKGRAKKTRSMKNRPRLKDWCRDMKQHFWGIWALHQRVCREGGEEWFVGDSCGLKFWKSSLSNAKRSRKS